MKYTTDLPREVLMDRAEQTRRHYGPQYTDIFFKFTCEKCGERCTLETANQLPEKGVCHKCGHHTEIVEGGFLIAKKVPHEKGKPLVRHVNMNHVPRVVDILAGTCPFRAIVERTDAYEAISAFVDLMPKLAEDERAGKPLKGHPRTHDVMRDMRVRVLILLSEGRSKWLAALLVAYGIVFDERYGPTNRAAMLDNFNSILHYFPVKLFNEAEAQAREIYGDPAHPIIRCIKQERYRRAGFIKDWEFLLDDQGNQVIHVDE